MDMGADPAERDEVGQAPTSIMIYKMPSVARTALESARYKRINRPKRQIGFFLTALEPPPVSDLTDMDKEWVPVRHIYDTHIIIY